MKKTLPSLRVEEKTLENILSAIKKYNKKNLVKFSLQEFRRTAYETLASLILLEKEDLITLD